MTISMTRLLIVISDGIIYIYDFKVSVDLENEIRLFRESVDTHIFFH
jgi:hypothetical protein